MTTTTPEATTTTPEAQAAVFSIAAELIAALIDNGFPEAELKGLAYTEREAVQQRKCVLLVSNADYDNGARKGFDTVFEYYIVIQQACAPSDMVKLNRLLHDVQKLVSLWDEDGPQRFKAVCGAEYDSGPSHPTGSLYESGVMQDHQMFTSVVAISYGVYA